MWLYSSSSKRSAGTPAPSALLRSTALRPTSPSSTIAEVLRKNPFRADFAEPRPKEPVEEDPSVPLNKDLVVLAEFFPDVKTEVLRELLVRFDGDSRLYICTEQLYKYKGEWAKGRLLVPSRDGGETPPADELFRTREYVDAVRWAVGREFSALNKSALDAVLAEVNFSYPNARPTLQALASRSWKIALANLFKKKRPQAEPSSALLDRTKSDDGELRLLATGSTELDRELSSLFSVRLERSRVSGNQHAIDLELAHALNAKEAEDAGALFECQVCYNDLPFEDVSICTQSDHTICLHCVRRALHEAIFGQGWANSVDVHHGTLKCLASSNSSDCHGYIPQDLVRRAVLREPSGEETWMRFEDRLAEYNLHTAAMPLKRCPFCSYAEVAQVYNRSSAVNIKWRVRRPSGISILTVILLLEAIPTILLLLLPLILLFPPLFISAFYTGLSHLALSKRTTRFVCRRPSCSRKSCLLCLKPWHDPHICHEPLILSLRTTVEAARTAAVKRTCPRCGTSFVKSSGCNKLTCVCGYSMCYLCRKNIGKAGSGSGGIGEGEGYRHFCEHFRPIPGQKCQECDKCDLYRAEDEDAQVRRAGEEAERLWREREGMVGVKGLEEATGNVAGEQSLWKRVREGRWSAQGCVDAIMERFVAVDVD